MMKRLSAYLVACVGTYLLAATAASQSVLSSLESMGVPVDLSTRLSVTGHDLLAMSGSYLPLIAIGLLIAFLVAGALSKLLSRQRLLLFVLAGAIAVFAIHALLKLSFGITPVAAARTGGGLVIQMLAGSAGGYLYLRIMGLVNRSAPR